ncbi:MAG: hypothetical protein HKN85_08305 [Gammaproteobacteria bacterium]|nr:hypothetical protein [Gammaproteobacteria bacterium]
MIVRTNTASISAERQGAFQRAEGVILVVDKSLIQGLESGRKSWQVTVQPMINGIRCDVGMLDQN